jgi:hypothetical protein
MICNGLITFCQTAGGSWGLPTYDSASNEKSYNPGRCP